MEICIHLYVVIHKAAPVEQVHHGLEAEDGLMLELGVVWNHDRSGLQLYRLVTFCPSKLLQPNLHHARNEMNAWIVNLTTGTTSDLASSLTGL